MMVVDYRANKIFRALVKESAVSALVVALFSAFYFFFRYQYGRLPKN